jgi:hypothetical protein
MIESGPPVCRRLSSVLELIIVLSQIEMRTTMAAAASPC